MSEEDRVDLAKRVFRHFGETAVDFMRAQGRTNDVVLATTKFEGLEYIDEALKQGKGVLIITGHLGNWERGAHWMSARGYKMSVIARDANQSDLNDLVLKMRNAAGVEVIARGNAVRPILQKLKRNELVAILPDQNSGESFIPFFGKPAGTVQGPAVLHIRTGAPLIPMACFADGPGKLHMVFRPEIKPLEGYEDPVDAYTAAVNLELEKLIREHPEQYLWFHDRWKAARRRGLV
jgi:KDO2-lipid IV(A) lauroyltransferase